jgi:hypothetical protein
MAISSQVTMVSRSPVLKHGPAALVREENAKPAAQFVRWLSVDNPKGLQMLTVGL